MSDLEILFSNKLKLDSDRVFLESENKSLTFKQFKSFAKKISTDLKKLHLKPQSLVLLDIRDPFYFAGYVFACFHLNIRPALLNSYFKPSQIDDVLKENSYDLFISDQKHSDYKTYDINSSEPFQFEGGDFNIDPKSQILFFTSGSIQSKACVLTLENFLYSALGSSENIPFHESHKWGLGLPLFHVGGFSILARAILAQATATLLDNQEDLNSQIEKFKITHASFVSTQFVRYLEQFQNLSSLQYILLGGSAIPELALKKAIELGLPIYKSYGMTEMASQICTTLRLDHVSDLGSSGKILNYRELKISDKNIYVKGPCLFLGYMKSNQIQSPFDSEGWFFTNDQGESHNKEIYIHGRADRIFQSAGENISPETIEQELLKVPGVLRAYVVPESDSQYGHRPIAYVEKQPGLEDDMILNILNKKLSGLYRPKTIKPWSESPKTSWKQ